jgi:hypothetical protein
MALMGLVARWTRRLRRRRPPASTPWRVFLSHTTELRDVPPGRSFVRAAEDAVRRARDALVDMAYFSAGEVSPARHCMDEMARVDVYVGIIGHRYGSPVREQPDLSYTELEFETAKALGLPRLIFFVDAPSRDDPIDVRQQRFRHRLRESGVTTATVTTPDELAYHLLQSLYELRTAKETRTRLRWPLVGAIAGGILAVAVSTRALPSPGPRSPAWREP